VNPHRQKIVDVGFRLYVGQATLPARPVPVSRDPAERIAALKSCRKRGPGQSPGRGV